ncbi:MAG TPA: hypothetical protein DCZ92_01365 [Elusimicrobia bacterium]|nr:MAG: hypothetical protein A2016_00530 [Elusimicrobia bacterium GWF2_62_30]HBA59476.1 hypothetical protein [Elusimicrobiota bacterium]
MAFVALALIVLLLLFFSPREGSRYGESPAAPAPPAAKPVEHKAAAVAVKKAALPPVMEKASKQRKKRVSRLRDPGEAMGGSAPAGLPEKPAGAAKTGK